jgi:LDH2 family malate/lactate/ureidoglycolate dehydrogenase
MLECITSVLLDNPMLEPYVYDRKVYDGHEIQNSLVAAIDIRTFTDVVTYKEHIDNLIDGIKALPKAEGFTEIFVPGEPEERTAAERRQAGIPLPEGTVHNLRGVAEKYGVKLPAGL